MIKELNIDDGTSVFESKTLLSSDPETLEISLQNGSDVKDEQLPLSVEVSTLSSAQKNEGLFLPEQESPLPSGQYSFTIGVEKNLYSFQFNVSAGSTNIELQTKLSDFINKTSIGLRTQVIRDTATGMSRLDLSAVSAGTPVSGTPAFLPQDTRYPKDSSCGIVTHFGLDHIVHMPENTTFHINKESYESRAHSYTTEYGLSMTFHDITGEPVIIDKVTDQAPIADKIQSFLDGYNSFLSLAKENRSQNHRARKLTHDLTTTVRMYAGELAAHGIHMEKDGSLTMDRDTVYTCAKDGSLENFFSKEHSFSSDLLKKLSDISLNPMEYLDKTVVTYPNTAAKKTYNPYVTSIYSGLLFNNYC
jgi:flagellar hook-associated protein 2